VHGAHNAAAHDRNRRHGSVLAQVSHRAGRHALQSRPGGRVHATFVGCSPGRNIGGRRPRCASGRPGTRSKRPRHRVPHSDRRHV